MKAVVIVVLSCDFNGRKVMLVQSVQIAQLATLDRDRLKVLLLAKELFPTWIAFTDFEKVNSSYIIWKIF